MREMQIKTAMRYHLNLSEWLSSISQQTNAGGSVEKGGPLCAVVGMKTGAATVESSMEIPQKIFKCNCTMTQQFHF